MKCVNRRSVDVKKAAVISVAANALQIALVLGVGIWLLMAPPSAAVLMTARLVVMLAAVVVCVGAAADIRESLNVQKQIDQLDAMNSTIRNMETLNNKLRAQRHDFLNHLQVVYSLMEMEEYAEANAYIEKVYGDITAVGRSLKTANAAVNALLQVKLSRCEKAGMDVKTDIRSAWRDLPIPGWEMCKVLSNLIDNAFDALRAASHPQLTITLSEDLKSYRFSVADNGPGIPADLLGSVFEAGVTTKTEGEGHGMGLYICRTTLNAFGGDLTVESGPGSTVFTGWVPRAAAEERRPEETADTAGRAG